MSETFRPFDVANYLKSADDLIAYVAASVRTDAIEECARVADAYVNEPIANAIRALKDETETVKSDWQPDRGEPSCCKREGD